MESTAIKISQINDFIFCPASIYFHDLYGAMNNMVYQSTYQINGTDAHSTIDSNSYSTKRSILTGMEVYCEKYDLIGKIDIYDSDKKVLRERKRKISNVYDGYIFQLYAQYFSLTEMGYAVRQLRLYSMDDNKIYNIQKPEVDAAMYQKFERLISDVQSFSIEIFRQDNPAKCSRCIYEPLCSFSLKAEGEGEGG